jgi:hypothetical protein
MPYDTSPTSRSLLLPEGAAAARLIVCERTGHWAAALRRELERAGGGGPFRAGRAAEVPAASPNASLPPRIDETRSLAHAFRALAEAPASFLIVELSRGNVDALLDRMPDLARWYPLARLAVLSDRRLAGWGWLLREAGAVWHASSPRRLAPLLATARRHLATAPRPRRSLRDRIWAGLPWGSGEEINPGLHDGEIVG